MNAFLQALNVMDCNEIVVLQLSDEIFVGLNSELIKSMVKDEKTDFYCGVTLEDNPQKIKNNFSEALQCLLSCWLQKFCS